MPELLVIVPSRGRPAAARELREAFDETCVADTRLLVVCDDDDPYRDEYCQLGNVLVSTAGRGMVHALNGGADDICRGEYGGIPFALGFMGDDHRPRTKGWDRDYLEALRGLATGIVYGNDLLQGEKLPTQVAMTADIVRALGFMAPPTLHHMYVDNWWKRLGEAAGCLRYLPDTIVEHLHPIAGKAEWDEGHKRVNAPQVYERDRRAYEAFCARHLWTCAARVRALRGAA